MKLIDWPASRWLFVFDAVVLTLVGGMAFGGSASHVYHLAIQHGQENFGAWSVTALAEVLFAYSGLEVRRRDGWTKLVPVFWLIVTATFIVWANLESTHDHTLTGYVIAVAPAVVFAGVASTAETRNWRKATPTVAGAIRVEGRALATVGVSPEDDTVHTPAQPSAPIAPEVAQPDHARPQVASRPSAAARTATRRPAGGRQARQAELRRVGADYLARLTGEQPWAAQDVAERLHVSRQRADILIKRWRAHGVEDGTASESETLSNS